MSDTQQINDIIQTYFDCMFESSVEKVHQAFHVDAKITGFMDNALQQMSVASFAELVGAQQPSAKDKGDTARLDILSLDIAGNTAVARVRDDYIGLTFLDTLSLIKLDSGWCIYNKLFYIEGPAA